MAEQIVSIKLPYKTAAGEIVAVDVSEEEYMERYAESFHEWVEGVVYKMSPISLKHNDICDYLRDVFRAYFSLRPIGRLLSAPFVMKVGKSRREPDLQIILKTNSSSLGETFVDGAADICIEIVSPSNEATDYGDKLREYEAAKVKEYWIIDPQRQQCLFYRLTAANTYQNIAPENEMYSSQLLPDLRFDTRVFWRLSYPNFYELGEMVKKMLEKAE